MVPLACVFSDALFRPLRGLALSPTTELYLGLVHADGVEATRARVAAASKYISGLRIAAECGIERSRTSELVTHCQIPSQFDSTRIAAQVWRENEDHEAGFDKGARTSKATSSAFTCSGFELLDAWHIPWPDVLRLARRFRSPELGRATCSRSFQRLTGKALPFIATRSGMVVVLTTPKCLSVSGENPG